MTARLLPRPGLIQGPYPERVHPISAASHPWAEAASKLVPAHMQLRRYTRFVEQVNACGRTGQEIDRLDIPRDLAQLRGALALHGLTDELVVSAFALIKRLCCSELGVELFSNQMMAGRIMLDHRFVEMATGEGKTLAVGVCSATAALAGVPVHVITANDYLVARDAQQLEPLYRALGLSVGAVTRRSAADERRVAYASDIVYCTASEIAFDYLRDGLLRRRSRAGLAQRAARLERNADSAQAPVLRGLCMAVVDEADSVLIDEARMPLVLSKQCPNERERHYLAAAFAIAQQLSSDRDFVLDRSDKVATLTEHGRAALANAAKDLDGVWRNRLHREETICTALAAIHLYVSDRQYIVREGSIAIVDESTGRLAPGRVWSRGLHQLIEIKEGCRTSGDTRTVAQITYQRFFRRYHMLTGISGTLREVRAELQSTYGLGTVSVPLRAPSQRRLLRTQLFSNRVAQRKAAVAEAAAMSGAGRPVLIGTDSVAESEALSVQLTKAHLPHGVLNARQDAEEARAVALAGQPGRITVATNMAGRGTDIRLGEGVNRLGGLHVICCQHNASARIDRQLLGRCARCDDRGSARILLALDQPLIARLIPSWIASRIHADGLERPQWFARVLSRFPQWREEHRQRAQRKALLALDLAVDRNPPFGQENV